MSANTNRDYEYDYCILQPPIVGIDLDRGMNMAYDPPIPSPIEDSQYEKDGAYVPADTPGAVLVYLNPRIRFRFFDANRLNLYSRVQVDLGADRVTGIKPQPQFQMGPDETRAPYYIEVDGEWVPLERYSYIASTGKDVNGNQVWSDSKYDISVDGPGTFSKEVDKDPEFHPPLKKVS